MAFHSYNQPEKHKVRQTIWLNAVGVLTGNRALAPVVRHEELSDTVDYALSILKLPKAEALEVHRELESWAVSYHAGIGQKKPQDLKVLYLCGPEPLNDLLEMLSHGIDPQNVWAIESSRTDFEAALQQLNQSGTKLKVHHGSLSDFLDLYTESFDIAYVDGCGPFVGGKPNTLDPLLSLLMNGRLEDLSVLVTNYAEVPKTQLNRYARLMSSFFRFRYNDVPPIIWKSNLDPAVCALDSEGLPDWIADHIDPFYSDFITRLTVDLARWLLPNCRALANKNIAASHLADRKSQEEAVARAEFEPKGVKDIHEWYRRVGDIHVNPTSYPVLSFFRAIDRADLRDPLVDQLGNLKFKGQDMKRLIPLAALLDAVFEGHWQILSPELLRAVQVSWFDQGRHFSCDVPLPNLLTNALLGVYGNPYFPNPRVTSRLKYQAKSTVMYTDMILFDKCRYFYDWFPVVQDVPNRFESKQFQIIARCIMDRISWSDWSSSSHPYQGGAVACWNDIPVANPHEFAPRVSIPREPTVK